jgi:hypothetical protein
MPVASAEYQVSRDANPLREISSINEAVYEIRNALQSYAEEPIVVFDEFDLITDDKDKQLFADLIKQISDQGIGLKMIFTGIGRAISDLLKIHNSTARYLETIELQRLDIDYRLEVRDHQRMRRRTEGRGRSRYGDPDCYGKRWVSALRSFDLREDVLAFVQ